MVEVSRIDFDAMVRKAVRDGVKWIKEAKEKAK
jgi:hypothetical protein